MTGNFREPSASVASRAYERILASATEAFGTYGFVKTTIQEIAVAAHVSKPLFYRHFRNKEHVFEHVVERVLIDWREAIAGSVSRSKGGTESELRVLFLDSLKYGRTHSLIGRLLTRDSQFLITAQSDVSNRACAELQSLIERILARGVDAGTVRADLPVAHMADLLMEVHFSYANRQIMNEAAIPRNLAQSIVESMWSAVKA